MTELDVITFEITVSRFNIESVDNAPSTSNSSSIKEDKGTTSTFDFFSKCLSAIFFVIVAQEQ